MKQNVVQEKSYAFALRIVTLCREILHQKREYVLSKQLLRAGTSIGANIEEALGAQSRREFYSKMSIAHREARETQYWLRLLRDAKIIDAPVAIDHIRDCTELVRILNTIRQTIERDNKKFT